MKTRTFVLALFAALTALSFSSCVHEWPEPAETQVVLHLDLDKTLPQGPTYEHNTRASQNPELYDLRYIIQAYKPSANGGWEETPYQKFVFTKDDISDPDYTATLTIMEGKYKFSVWSDYVLQGSVEDHYYNANNFKYIKLFGQDEGAKHVGNDDYRDCFMGSKEVEVIRFGGNKPPVNATIKLERPVSKVVFITADLEDWKTKVITNHYQSALQNAKPGETVEVMREVDLSQYIVKIHYPVYMPVAFNMVSDHTAWSDVNVTFESKIIQMSDTEASLGFDYVFANTQDATATMAVSLYDKNGTQLAHSKNIPVPLERGKVTVVRGSFLLEESDGGVSINPDFDGEFNIKI